MSAEKPILDQYYPGGTAQQALDWNVSQHEAISTGASDLIVGDGYMQIGPVIQNWGMITSWSEREGMPAQQTITFAIPYVNGVPALVAMCEGTGTVQLLNLTQTNATVSVNPVSTVHWQAIGQ